MNISIFGLGYVGAVTGACLAKLGHNVVGVDPDEQKLGFIRQAKSPILEEGLEELIGEVIRSGRLSVTADVVAAVAQTELSLICVGTPSLPNGALRTDFVERVSHQIGSGIRAKGRYHSVVVRSTVLPGTTEGIVVPILERECAGRRGDAFGISMHPEFLREGSSIRDFYDPPFTVVGTDDANVFEGVCSIYQGTGKSVAGARIQCQIRTAEAIKYACNLFHATKITFANEIGLVCKQAGVDSREVMDIVGRDEKLNISRRYLRPGFAFGGSCLPKDLRAFVDYGRKTDVAVPMLEGMLTSNRVQIERVAERIRTSGRRKVSLMGLAFKEGTDDLRESPLVLLAENLIGKGYDLRIFDPSVQYASLYGSNKQFIDKELPHLKQLLVAGEAAVAHAEVLVFGHNSGVYRDYLEHLSSAQVVFDLAGVANGVCLKAKYEGLYW